MCYAITVGPVLCPHLFREAGGEVFTATLNTTSKDHFVKSFVACVLPFLPLQTGEFIPHSLYDVTFLFVHLRSLCWILECAIVSQEEKQDIVGDGETETEKDPLFVANIAWLVRINGTFDYKETASSSVDQDLLDEQVLHLTQLLRVSVSFRFVRRTVERFFQRF